MVGFDSQPSFFLNSRVSYSKNTAVLCFFHCSIELRQNYVACLSEHRALLDGQGVDLPCCPRAASLSFPDHGGESYVGIFPSRVAGREISEQERRDCNFV